MTVWEIDPSHSGIHFSVRHLVIAKVHGRFERFSGRIEGDGANAKVTATIEAASINTSDAKRDEHLRSGDFLDIAAHPNLTFVSTGIEKNGSDFTVKGDLTIRGSTHPITLKVESLGQAKDPWGGERVGYSATTSINRSDFGVKFNMALEAGGVMVGEKVDITLEIEAVKKA